MLHLAEIFDRAGVAFSPHNPTGPVCHAASLQVCAAAGSIDRLEVQFDETPLFAKLVGDGVPPVQNGVSKLPPGSGTGVRLAKDVVAGLLVDRLELAASTGL
jgi:galactonate dehydratase